MKMYVWSSKPFFLAVAHADSVTKARQRLLIEIGEGGDGSCPIRDQARSHIANNQPEIWMDCNAEFALTDSAEVIEQDAENTRLRDRITTLEKVISEIDTVTRGWKHGAEGVTLLRVRDSIEAK